MLALRNSNVIKTAACCMGSQAVAVRAFSQEASNDSTKDHPNSWDKEKLQMELQNAEKLREHELTMKRVWPNFAMNVVLIETVFRFLTGRF